MPELRAKRLATRPGPEMNLHRLGQIQENHRKSNSCQGYQALPCRLLIRCKLCCPTTNNRLRKISSSNRINKHNRRRTRKSQININPIYRRQILTINTTMLTRVQTNKKLTWLLNSQHTRSNKCLAGCRSMAQMFRGILYHSRRFQPGLHQPFSILDSICKRRMLRSVRFKIRSNRSTRFRISNIKRSTSNRVIYNHQ